MTRVGKLFVRVLLVGWLVWSGFATNSSVTVPANCSIPAEEYLALYDLYESTNGAGWAWRNSEYEWDFSGDSDPCVDSWEGLTCSETVSPFHITNINLTSYNMVGSIPSSIGVFSNLTVLSMAVNYLSGTIPTSFGNLSSLVRLQLNQNQLNGTIPQTIGSLLSLEIVEIKNNTLTGSLPQSMGALTNLLLLDLYLNQLTGTVPSFFSNLLQIQYLDIYSNKFHGTIPAFLGELRFLRYLYLGKNSLTGTIPSSIGALNDLISFYANTNRLVGTVPSSISQLPNLEFLFLYENELSGNMNSIFNASVQRVLKNVVLYDNRFTGNLPEQLFEIPTVEVVDCSNNCLEGGLPKSLCGSMSLKTLALDGMCAAPSCRDYIFKRLKTYILRNTISEGIPPCVFELPHLETLHISGNGMTGSLPANVTFSDTFSDLSLSQNDLTGELSLPLQVRKWSNLDLSNNRITGTLSGAFAEQTPDAHLQLSNNRLSGRIPSGILDSAGAVDILDGNLFACDIDKTNLPEQDPKYSTYECGSNTFDLSYYVWLGVAFFLGGLIVVQGVYIGLEHESVFGFLKKMCVTLFSQPHLLDEWEIPGPGEDGRPLKFLLRRYRRVCDMFKLLRRLGFLISLFIVTILLPFYAIVSLYATTLTYQYAYTMSIAYLSGKVAAGLAMALLLILLVHTFACFALLLVDYQKGTARFAAETNFPVVLAINHHNDSYDENRKRIDKGAWEKFFVYSALVMTDVIIVSLANIGFVYFVIYGTEDILPLVQLALSIFKIGWGEVCSWVMYRLAVHVDFHAKSISRAMVSLYACVLLINNIVVPCLVVMAVSTTCFYNLVVQSNSIESSYDYLECAAYDVNGCYQHTTITTTSSFTPPFVYSYQCSASIITYYAPSFVYLCIISGFIIPFYKYVLAYNLVRLDPEKCCCGECVPLKYMILMVRWVMKKVTPSVLLPINPKKLLHPSLNSPYFDARTQLVMIYNYLAVMLTFGAMFPPLAFAMFVLIISSICCARMEVKWFLKEAAQKNLPEYIKIIDRNCMGFGSDHMLLRGASVLVILASFFYTLFIFDTLGDQVKFNGAYWVLIVMPLLPLTVICLFMWYIGTSFVGARMHRHSVNSPSWDGRFILKEILRWKKEFTKSPLAPDEEDQQSEKSGFDEISSEKN